MNQRFYFEGFQLSNCLLIIQFMLCVERLAANMSRLRPHVVKSPSSTSHVAARSLSVAGVTVSQQHAEKTAQGCSKSLDGFLRCVAACNQGAEQQQELVPLYIEDACIGYVRPRRVTMSHHSPSSVVQNFVQQLLLLLAV